MGTCTAAVFADVEVGGVGVDCEDHTADTYVTPLLGHVAIYLSSWLMAAGVILVAANCCKLISLRSMRSLLSTAHPYKGRALMTLWTRVMCDASGIKRQAGWISVDVLNLGAVEVDFDVFVGGTHLTGASW